MPTERSGPRGRLGGLLAGIAVLLAVLALLLSYAGQRLAVMAENDADDISWYPSAYQGALQETPFRFRNAAELTDPSKLAESCRANRGPATAPLFPVNHWVDTSPAPPRRSPRS